MPTIQQYLGQSVMLKNFLAGPMSCHATQASYYVSITKSIDTYPYLNKLALPKIINPSSVQETKL